MFYLPTFGAKIWQAIWCQYGDRENRETLLGGPYLPGDVHVTTNEAEGTRCDGEGDMDQGITVDREPVYQAATHPKCVATGICQGSC